MGDGLISDFISNGGDVVFAMLVAYLLIRHIINNNKILVNAMVDTISEKLDELIKEIKELRREVASRG